MSIKKACDCTTCCGTLVSVSTFRRHRDRPRVQPQKTYSYAEWLHSNQTHASTSLMDSRDEAEDIETDQVGSGSRKRARLLSLSEHEYSSEEQDIHQPPDAEQIQQDKDEMTHVSDMDPAISGPESDFHVRELSDSEDFYELIVDDIEEDKQTAAATCAHAQTILDAYIGTQDASNADTEEDIEQLSEAHIESLHVAQEYINLIQKASLDEDKLSGSADLGGSVHWANPY